MCGIVGYFGTNHDNLYKNNALKTILHRGGENKKSLLDDNFYLGFTRLAINDLHCNATSPFVDDGVIVACNGEIYNYKELNNQLKTYKMKSSNDTEIIINLYLEYGRKIEEVLKRIKGMFAISLIDLKKNVAYLIRDQIGIKPFYYCIENNNLYYSSEIKTFKYIKEYCFKPNYEQLFRILCYRSTSNAYTAFKNIYKVEPATYIEVNLNNNHIKKKKYWYYPKYEPKKISKKTIKQKITNIINQHTISDVPISTTLSGGLDSSIISAVVSKKNSNLCTFSSFYNVLGDETEKFELVKNYLNVKNEKVLIDRDNFLKILNELVYYMDEPFADPAVLPLYFISKAIHNKKIKLTIMGEGADEVFLGYKKYRETIETNEFSFNDYIEKRSPFKLEQLKKMNYELFDVFKKELDSIIKDYGFDKITEKDVILNRLSQFDIERMLPNLQLMRADKATMVNTVEARVPFLYTDTISLAQQIKATREITLSNEKELLRDAFDKELPKEIIHGKKQIFFVPLDYLVDDKNKKVMINKISDSKVIKKLIKIKEKGKIYNSLDSYQIWILYMIALWEEKYL